MFEVIVALFAANAVILAVMAVAFWFAGRGRSDQPYWNSWGIANALLTVALAIFIFEPMLPRPLADILPNGLLVAGFGLRWRAAREFGQRPTHRPVVWGPLILFFAACTLAFVIGSYRATYTVVNIVLAAYALATAWEFWRDRADALPSRHGLVAAYAVLGISFSARVVQGLIDGDAFGSHLPQDVMLVIHLCIALLHTPASGAFALSLAFERSTARLKHEASHDALTGLFNRRAFEQALRRQIETAVARPFAVLLFDIDHFKAINDRYGHAAGDGAIRAFAAVLEEQLPAPTCVARIGGEEFAAVLQNVIADEAHHAAERVRRTVRASVVSAGKHHLSMTVSAGIYHSANGAADFDEMMRMADAGLYAAKNAGRDRVESLAA